MPLESEDFAVDQIRSTLVIRPPYDENKKPTSNDFNINKNLGGKC